MQSAKRKAELGAEAGERTFGLPVTECCVLRKLVRYIFSKDNDNDNSKLAMILICRVLRAVIYALCSMLCSHTPYSILCYYTPAPESP